MVAFLHGVTLDSRMWDEQLQAFGEHWRCLAIDLRGHGKSAPLVAGYDPAADLREVLAAERVDRCVVVGLSLGGHDALVFAGLQPDHCAGLVLVDAWLPGPELAGWEPPFRLARAQGATAAREAWLADALFAGSAARPTVRSRLAEMVGANDLRIWTDATPRASHPPARDLASRVETPTQVLVGEDDLPGFRAVARWLAERIPGAAGRPLATVPGAGHMLPMDDPGAFNAVLADFVSSLPGRG